MRWPPWSSKDQNEKIQVKWADTLNATDWSHYTDPRTVIPTILLTSTALLLARLHHSYLRRIPQAGSIQPAFWRQRSLLGRVTSVGDGDNFRLFHTPGGRLAGWGWIPGRRVPEKREELKDKTVRLFPELKKLFSRLNFYRFTFAWLAWMHQSLPTLVVLLNLSLKRH